MSSPDEILRDAVAAHLAGHLTVAEVGYSKVLRKRPADHQALYGLGVIHYDQGARDSGIQYLLRCLQISPDNATTWNTLGSMLIETGKLVEGKAAYQRALELSPELSEGWYNLAVCSKREGDLEGATQQLRRAIACPAPFSKAYEVLATMLYEQGHQPEAAQTLADWAASEPTNPIARHMVAAASATEAPSRASDDYVRAHFDGFADTFDSKLKALGYRGPQLVADALTAAVQRRRPVSSLNTQANSDTPALASLLDAGCGTGLCGPLVRKLCRTLVGVDLSLKMLAHAQRRGCYDELVAAELGAFMRSRPQAFEALVCADTLNYFGSLAEPLAAAHECLRAGAPLVFTVEALASDASIHRLGVSGRYAHSESYLRRTLADSGFDVESIARENLRTENGTAVEAYLVVARRAGVLAGSA